MTRQAGWKPADADLHAGRFLGVCAVHLAALAAPFFFSWAGLTAFVILSMATRALGISLGFHRYLAHGSFKTTRTIRYTLAFLGTLAAQAGPVNWVAMHRLHHARTDRPDDPHSPRDSVLWAHLGWTFFDRPGQDHATLLNYARDIVSDPVLAFMERHMTWICVAVMAALFGLGTAMGGWRLGVSCFLWGGVLRTAYVWHATFIVNSALHRFGYRNHPTRDSSTNSALVNLLIHGDGWHNNHHAFPRAAGFGHRPSEVDPLFFMLRILEKVGLTWDVVPPPRTFMKHSSTSGMRRTKPGR